MPAFGKNFLFGSCLLGAVSIIGISVIVTSISACGNRGALYLKKEDESKATRGRFLRRSADEHSENETNPPENKDKKKAE